METQAEFDARRAAAWAFRDSPEGQRLIEQGSRALDALIAAQDQDYPADSWPPPGVRLTARTEETNVAGTPTSPVPASTGTVEPKVKAASIGTYLAGLVLVALVSGLTDGNLVAEFPDWASALLAPVLPTLVAMAAGYNARHQYRSPEAITTR